jgi:hypothetical protein
MYLPVYDLVIIHSEQPSLISVNYREAMNPIIVW